MCNKKGKNGLLFYTISLFNFLQIKKLFFPGATKNKISPGQLGEKIQADR
jgi:hypothetical protein